MRFSESRLAIDLEFISPSQSSFTLGLEEVQTIAVTVRTEVATQAVSEAPLLGNEHDRRCDES